MFLFFTYLCLNKLKQKQHEVLFSYVVLICSYICSYNWRISLRENTWTRNKFTSLFSDISGVTGWMRGDFVF